MKALWALGTAIVCIMAVYALAFIMAIAGVIYSGYRYIVDRIHG